MPAGCGFAGEVNAALEINTTANQVYQLNFADTKLLQKNIEVSVHDFITSGKMFCMPGKYQRKWTEISANQCFRYIFAMNHKKLPVE